MSPAVMWMAVALVAIGIEVFMVDLTFGLIAVGAGAAGVAALAGAPLWLQAVIGVGVSVAGIGLVRPVALRHMRRSAPGARTGVDALPGATARALSEVTADDGRISLRGEIWSARLDPDVTSVPVATGTPLVVTRIDGATALVFPVDPPTP
ncbi:MAG: NfeD family protein [Candidatus Nanopelagicales bacterium]